MHGIDAAETYVWRDDSCIYIFKSLTSKCGACESLFTTPCFSRHVHFRCDVRLSRRATQVLLYPFVVFTFTASAHPSICLPRLRSRAPFKTPLSLLNRQHNAQALTRPGKQYHIANIERALIAIAAWHAKSHPQLSMSKNHYLCMSGLLSPQRNISLT
jgi:hypothetical protein